MHCCADMALVFSCIYQSCRWQTLPLCLCLQVRTRAIVAIMILLHWCLFLSSLLATEPLPHLFTTGLLVSHVSGALLTWSCSVCPSIYVLYCSLLKSVISYFCVSLTSPAPTSWVISHIPIQYILEGGSSLIPSLIAIISATAMSGSTCSMFVAHMIMSISQF